MSSTTLIASADTYLQQGSPTINHGTEVFLAVGFYPADDIQRSLVQFDLSTIPAGATIESATLDLTLDGNFTTVAYTTYIYQVLVPWTELGATWDTEDGTTAWNSPGCGGIGTDRKSVASGSVGVDASTVGIVSIPLSVSDIQSWVDGSLTNNGIIIVASDETDQTMIRWDSTQNGIQANDPSLVVTYSTSSGPPIGSFCLLGVGR